MPTSMKKLEPLEIHFGEDFEGFWEAQWSEVGTKMASQIDLIFSAASRGPATVLPRKSRLRGGLGTSLGGFGGLWAAFGWCLAPRGLLGVL